MISCCKTVFFLLLNVSEMSLVIVDELVDSILESWFSCSDGGKGIGYVLFGDYKPSGFLPISFTLSF
ncbi:glycoside hydrolase family 3 C-terminal domain-containing protein [Salmonella enterica subsp. enterica serovar Infantis]